MTSGGEWISKPHMFQQSRISKWSLPAPLPNASQTARFQRVLQGDLWDRELLSVLLRWKRMQVDFKQTHFLLPTVGLQVPSLRHVSQRHSHSRGIKPLHENKEAALVRRRQGVDVADPETPQHRAQQASHHLITCRQGTVKFHKNRPLPCDIRKLRLGRQHAHATLPQVVPTYNTMTSRSA